MKVAKNRRLIPAFGLSLACLLGAEIVLRFCMGFGDPPLARMDDTVEYILEPNRSYHRFGNRIEINSFGLRAPPMTAKPPAGEPRILVIGDSVIYGNHFLDQSEMVTTKMAEALAGCQASVVPVAISSWGPVNQAAFLEVHGTFGALSALIVVSGHDLYDTPTFSKNVVPYRLRPSFTAIDDVIRAILLRFASVQPKPDLSQASRATMSLNALKRMTDQLKAAGASPILVYHPSMRERLGRPMGAALRFQNWANENRIVFLHLGDALPKPGVYRDNLHPAADGAARIAKVLSAAIRDDLVPC